MKPETQKKIVRALQRKLKKILGHNLPADGKSAAKQARSALKAGDLSRSLRAGISIGLWSAAEERLANKPEPTPEELRKFLRDLDEAEMAPFIRSFLNSELRKLPPLPRGKQPKFKERDRDDLLAELRQLETTVSRKEAYKQLAATRGVHWRTIQNLSIKASKTLSPLTATKNSEPETDIDDDADR